MGALKLFEAERLALRKGRHCECNNREAGVACRRLDRKIDLRDVVRGSLANEETTTQGAMVARLLF